MKALLRILRAALAGLVLVAFTASVMHSKPEYAKKEKTSCTTCHVKPGAKELNGVGKCYEEKKSLDGCKAPEKK